MASQDRECRDCPRHQLLTVDEVADYLKKPRSWVYDHGDELPRFKVGAHWRYRLCELDGWLDETRHLSTRLKG